MRKLFTALTAIFAITTAHADEWTGQDKKLHALGGGAVALTMTAHTGSATQGFAWGCGAGLAKEALDATGFGHVSAKDFVVTCIGAAVGAGGGRVFVAPIGGGVKLAFFTKF